MSICCWSPIEYIQPLLASFISPCLLEGSRCYPTRETICYKSDSRNPCNFRPIALTLCIGKLFTAILKKRVLSYVISNAYLNTSIQKAFINAIPGCFEQKTKLSYAIQEARLQQRRIAICWLDLTNAFGSVEHNLILLTLQHYHLDPAFINLIRAFYRLWFVCCSDNEVLGYWQHSFEHWHFPGWPIVSDYFQSCCQSFCRADHWALQSFGLWFHRFCSQVIFASICWR